jgi:hypothetical protein
VLAHGLAEITDRDRRRVALRRVGNPVVPKRVVERDDAARAQQPQRLAQVLAVLGLLPVAEHEVVGLVGEPGQHFERRTADQAGAGRREAGVGVRLLGHPLVLGLDVDRGQQAVGMHPTQQPHA